MSRTAPNLFSKLFSDKGYVSQTLKQWLTKDFDDNGVPKGGYEDINEAKRAISDYIWGYYQTIRPHTFNNYLTPVEKEKRYFNKNLLTVV